MIEPEFAKRYTLQLDDGRIIDVLADALEIADMMVFFRQVGRDQFEPMRGVNTDIVVTFEVNDYDPDDVEVEDSAPTIMDTGWGYNPNEDVREGNPYVKEHVPDPFRGGLKFTDGG